MPTANSSKHLPEELQLLARAVEGDTFHFVVVQWGHFSLLQRTKDHLRQQYPERPALSLRAAGQTYEALMEPIYGAGTGFVFFDDFENLLNTPDLCVPFNQRRGKLARMPLSVVCFIPPGEHYVELCIQRLPDWWSVLTLLAELSDPEVSGSLPMKSSFQEALQVSTLGGTNQQDRLEEIQRLQKRLAKINVLPQNANLLDGLHSQILELCQTAGLYHLGLTAANEWLKTAFELNYEKNAPTTYSLILDRIGTFERYLGNYDRAVLLLEAALVNDLKNFGPDHPNVATSQSNLAIVYRNMGEYSRAMDLISAAIASDLKNLGPDHPEVAIRQANQALVYGDMGDYSRAKTLLEAAIASDLKNFGPNHPRVSTSQSNLANVYRAMGDYSRAKTLLEAAIASDLKNLGPDHPEIAIHQSNLAIVYWDMFDYDRARTLLETALANGLKNLGPDHPEVAIRQSNLANVYRAMGDYRQARDLLIIALASDLKNLGPDHPEVAIHQSNLAIVYWDMFDYDRARALLETALANDIRNLGAEHPYTKMDQKNLSSLLEEMKGR